MTAARARALGIASYAAARPAEREHRRCTLLWAARRLRALPQRKKYLVVLSDGAPVRLLTILENGPTICLTISKR